MKELVNEWIRKAKKDEGTAKREALIGEDANSDAVCFHAQQAIEKCLKGLLQHCEIRFSKTHDLSALLELLLPRFPDLNVLDDDMEWMSAFAVEIRYPGEDATETDVKTALIIMENALTIIRDKIEDN